jgi:acid phosphatase
MIGDLAFANDWKFFASEPVRDFDQLTRSGPYAGTLAAFATGVRMRTRYGHLLEKHFKSRERLNFWAGDSHRVIETAEHFAAGLLGLDWNQQATLHVIPEDPSTGGDTLTPGKACLNYIHDLEKGREGGYTALATFTDAMFVDTAARLEKFITTTSSRAFKLATVDVYAMQELCGFEILSRGSSQWCDVFTRTEWERFAYARDLLHFFRAGPGGKYSRAMGGLYLNATTELMLQGPAAGGLFFSL